MSIIAAAVKHMLAAGVPTETILAAIAEMESGLVAGSKHGADEPKRSAHAARQERYRLRKASQKASQGVTNDEQSVTSDGIVDESVTSDATTAVALSPSPSPKEIPHTPLEITPTPNPKPEKIKRGTRLPDDWVLSQELGQWAVDVYELSPDFVREQAASFKDFWIAKAGADACKRDWAATWRNWIRNARTRASPKAYQTKPLKGLALIREQLKQEIEDAGFDGAESPDNQPVRRLAHDGGNF